MSRLIEDLGDKYENLEELQQAAVVLMSTYMKRALGTAVKYVEAAGRHVVTTIDITLCMRQELLRDRVWKMGNRGDFVREAVEVRETLFGEDDGEESDEEESDDDESYDEDETTWTPAPENSRLVRDIHRAQFEWETWSPEDATEKLLKNTVETVQKKVQAG